MCWVMVVCSLEKGRYIRIRVLFEESLLLVRSGVLFRYHQAIDENCYHRWRQGTAKDVGEM